MKPDDLDARVADDEEQVYMAMQLVHEEGERQNVDYDPPHPLDGLDMERLASFNLKQIRTALGISQQQIADKLTADRAAGHHDVKLSQTQIAKIERGERPWRLNELVAIAAALGVALDEFFSGQPASNDAKMLVRTAKLKYQRAKANEEEARDALKAAIRDTYEAENALLRAAARHQIQDPEVLKILSLRGVRSWWADDARKEPLPDRARDEDRKEYAVKFVAEEWVRLTKEETGKPPEQPVHNLPLLES
ncbi:helix-turn-helix domain-containing protein [Streptomyces sp. NPDC007856]|uniref:helix-turn-helix domain-containing protein n=1 Tax=Streptomyces sp. NPDC007856 TaxID=3364781 RepID=UPI0036D1B948